MDGHQNLNVAFPYCISYAYCHGDIKGVGVEALQTLGKTIAILFMCQA